MNIFKKSDYLYTKLFCEENIWQLAKSLIKSDIDEKKIHVMFITNHNKHIAIYNQLATEPNQAVIWDYHVILILKIKQSVCVFDFDSRLDFPTPINNYFQHSLPDNIKTEYHSQFRMIAADNYLQNFYSDRSHMKNIIADADFPQYPAIVPSSKEKMQLNDLLKMKKQINNTLVFPNTKQLINWLTNR
jgi:protein N-terminal glutamine amidohydrolase